MVLYRCICGKELDASENSETTRARKREFKKSHDNKKNPGHKYARIVMKGRRAQ